MILFKAVDSIFVFMELKHLSKRKYIYLDLSADMRSHHLMSW